MLTYRIRNPYSKTKNKVFSLLTSLTTITYFSCFQHNTTRFFFPPGLLLLISA